MGQLFTQGCDDDNVVDDDDDDDDKDDDDVRNVKCIRSQNLIFGSSCRMQLIFIDSN